MTHEVYANGNEIAGKAGMGKVTASFPDVCLSPPGPPAGPIPVPYPDTSFSSDLKEGSTTVSIGGQPAALAQQSYYQPSALGNEAATRAWGMSVVTHQITGKTYFQAWSMDVQIEGKQVCRHSDIATCNHASTPGATPPNPNLEAVEWGDAEDQPPPSCVCCNSPRHSAGTPMTMDDWYTKDSHGNLAPHAADYRTLMSDVANRKAATPPCTCSSKLIPSAPCNVFRRPVSDAEYTKIKRDWKNLRATYQGVYGIPDIPAVTTTLTSTLGRAPTIKEIDDERRVNHLVPKTAGGCPVGDGNLESNGTLCAVCRALDDRFGELQSRVPRS